MLMVWLYFARKFIWIKTYCLGFSYEGLIEADRVVNPPIIVYTLSIYNDGGSMTATKVFQSGNSQAVRIPKKYHINSNRVEIFKKNNELIIREMPDNLKQAFELLIQMPEDAFAEDRVDTKPQERKF